MTDPLASLQDRSIPFAERCLQAHALLTSSTDAGIVFPRRHQVLFDWLVGSLVKQARGEVPRSDVFLAPEVWSLLSVFLDALLMKNCNGASKKRKLDQEFVKCFDPTALIVKVPLLLVFQTALQLLDAPNTAMERVILGFLSQNRSSLPVNLTQIIDFITVVNAKSAHLCQAKEMLQVSLGIFTQIITSGAANYKKSYPQLLTFALNTSVSGNEELWIEAWQRCLFPEVDELLKMLTSDVMRAMLEGSKSVEFAKTASMQKLMFTELAKLTQSGPATLSCLYEAFLRAASGKVDRESGFNFLAFLIAHCPAVKGNAPVLARLLAILHGRGNEIYQQRNDDTYRAQSAIIEKIFEEALGVGSFGLMLEVAHLNYYLVLSRMPEIIGKMNDSGEEQVSFMAGMFKLAAQANQIPVFVEGLVGVQVTCLTHERVQDALTALFARGVPLAGLLATFEVLESAGSVSQQVLLRPLLKNVYRLLDARLLSPERFCALQKRLLLAKEYDLLAFLVNCAPTHLDLDEALFTTASADTGDSLRFALKLKNPAKVSVTIDRIDDYQLCLQFLPIISDSLSPKALKKFAKWILALPQRSLLMRYMQNSLFFEIDAFRPVFIAECAGDAQVISCLPAEYLSDEEAIELGRSLLSVEPQEAAMKALLACPRIPSRLRIPVLEALVKQELKRFAKFLLACEGDLISKCVHADTTGALLERLLDKTLSVTLLARILKYTSHTQYPEDVQKQVKKAVEVDENSNLDDLEAIMAWSGNKAALKLMKKMTGLDEARLLALRCRFHPQSVKVAEAVSVLVQNPSNEPLRRNLILLIKGLESADDLIAALDSLLVAPETWIIAIGQLLQTSAHNATAFNHFFAHFEGHWSAQLLPVIKSACQLKKGVTWNAHLLARILGKLRAAAIKKESNHDEIGTILRLLIDQHWRMLRGLVPLLIACMCEFLQIPAMESSLSRAIHELASLRVGQVDAYALLPLLHAFSRSSTLSRVKSLQMAMNGVLRHFSSQPQLMQMLSSALIVEDEQRLLLKSFMSEYNKFYKYTGRA